jgi:hypothetical protein
MMVLTAVSIPVFICACLVGIGVVMQHVEHPQSVVNVAMFLELGLGVQQYVPSGFGVV